MGFNFGNDEFEGTPIPEGYKDTAVGKYKTIGEVFKGYGEAQKLIGAKGVVIPAENASQEEVDKFHNSLGRPVKSDDYKLTPIEGLHPSMKLDDEANKAFKELAHKHGLSQKAADGLYKDLYTGVSGKLAKKDETSKKAFDEAVATLKTEWGADYETKLNQASRLIKKFGGDTGIVDFGDLGGKPGALRILAKIAGSFSEDGFIKGGPEDQTAIKDAQKKINDILLNKEHAYWKQGVGHQEAIEEMKALQAIANPDIDFSAGK